MALFIMETLLLPVVVPILFVSRSMLASELVNSWISRFLCVLGVDRPDSPARFLLCMPSTPKNGGVSRKPVYRIERLQRALCCNVCAMNRTKPRILECVCDVCVGAQ